MSLVVRYTLFQFFKPPWSSGLLRASLWKPQCCRAQPFQLNAPTQDHPAITKSAFATPKPSLQTLHAHKAFSACWKLSNGEIRHFPTFHNHCHLRSSLTELCEKHVLSPWQYSTTFYLHVMTFHKCITGMGAGGEFSEWDYIWLWHGYLRYWALGRPGTQIRRHEPVQV